MTRKNSSSDHDPGARLLSPGFTTTSPGKQENLPFSSDLHLRPFPFPRLPPPFSRYTPSQVGVESWDLELVRGGRPSHGPRKVRSLPFSLETRGAKRKSSAKRRIGSHWQTPPRLRCLGSTDCLKNVSSSRSRDRHLTPPGPFSPHPPQDYFPPSLFPENIRKINALSTSEYFLSIFCQGRTITSMRASSSLS